MDDQNKYYTPRLEEFHVGFEYEMKSMFGDGTVKTQKQYDDADWGKEVFTIGCFPYVERTMTGKNSQNLPPAIRVKHLDREDIESFGFKHKGSLWFQNQESGYRAVKIRKWKGLEVDIYRHDSIEDVRIFSGKIKNKSELKRLLKQLEIL